MGRIDPARLRPAQEVSCAASDNIPIRRPRRSWRLVRARIRSRGLIRRAGPRPKGSPSPSPSSTGCWPRPESPRIGSEMRLHSCSRGGTSAPGTRSGRFPRSVAGVWRRPARTSSPRISGRRGASPPDSGAPTRLDAPGPTTWPSGPGRAGSRFRSAGRAGPVGGVGRSLTHYRCGSSGAPWRIVPCHCNKATSAGPSTWPGRRSIASHCSKRRPEPRPRTAFRIHCDSGGGGS
jgi:hypothetical protein